MLSYPPWSELFIVIRYVSADLVADRVARMAARAASRKGYRCAPRMAGTAVRSPALR